ncbi:hypothetical protein BCV72DRAFT_116262 [Rhizopus microsporus var. microsporus]|nr:hypothetical protein BCV72DRAFT_116262 [Rhizopus microsporus var. microsporus]
MMRANSQDQQKLNLISKLASTGVINTVGCLFKQSLCSILIQLVLDQTLQSSDINRLLNLLPFINRNSQPDESFISVFDSIIESSLLSIFLRLPSPSIDPQLSQSSNHDVAYFLYNLSPHLPGMKTTLYQYQKNSLQKMLERELVPKQVDKPEVIQFKAIDGSTIYLNQYTGALSSKPDRMTDLFGGIICEDMGTGKTCLCLAAVMATKDLLYPFSSINTDCFIKTNLKKHQPHTLKAIAAEQLLSSGINWNAISDRLPEDVVEWFQAYPLHYEWVDIPLHFNFERSRRREPQFTRLVVYVSNATLIIVPDNLIDQWTGEIYKHVQDGKVHFTVYDQLKQVIKPPLELLDLDLVIISQSRFAHENQQGGLDFRSTVCQCPYIGSTRERACICAVTEYPKQYVSPLLQIHWKRVIVDEGHRLSNENKLAELSRKLFCNAKWVCTGTPTHNLTDTTLSRKDLNEADDLDRLGKLFGQALGMEPFKDSKKLWHRMVTRPFLSRKPWGMRRLIDILERTMIRTQRQDIEKEVSLPPLHQDIVFLDFDYYQWLTHNCQIAMIALNAILSKREGPDYLFSSKNYKSLRETVHNLWQSCLWHSVSPGLIEAAYNNCLEKCHDVEQGKEDYGQENEDLKSIRAILHEAVSCEMFMQIMTSHFPALIVQGLPHVFKEHWGLLKGSAGAYTHIGSSLPWEDGPCVVQEDKLIDILEMLSSMKSSDMQHLFYYDGAQLRTIDPNKSEQQTESQEAWTFYTRHALSDARILGATSSKLNYLVNQVVKYQPTEKCIIFAQHHNEMVEIYWLLTHLAKIRVLIYHESKMSNSQRSQIIMTFNTSENANVIIMPVRKAAYGIDLSSATRIFFVSPVWQTAMEQQAIKRAHRIGQTRPVYVETLVIRNTIEHELLKRREQVEENSQDFFTDSKLKHILNHARFAQRPKHEHDIAIPLLHPIYLLPSERKRIVPDKKEDIEKPSSDTVDIEGHEEIKKVKSKGTPPPEKKRKTVRFSD